MQSDPDVNVMELIDSQRLSGAQITIVVLCGLIAVLDGLDLQAIGLAAPALAAALHIAPRALGSVFSAALAGWPWARLASASRLTGLDASAC
jgi:MFS transporter, AAHS family, 4-hydroxybenzoate transporter